jgi:hypothetical protein
MIRPISKMPTFPIQIDLTGPDGNVFALMGIARNLSKVLNKRRDAQYFDADAIIADMKSDDYEHALEVMEKHFGEFIIMYQ